MRKVQLTLFGLVSMILSTQVNAQQKNVIGYYLSWQWNNSPEIFNPQNIPYDKLTAVYYSFFYPLESGKIVGMDAAADRYLLKGEKDVKAGKPQASLIDLAHSAGTKVVLSIGGWEHSDNFPAVSADPQKRANFAHWCVRHIRNYGFDGIDVDWEFPGYVRHQGTSQDRRNFTLLLEMVRDSLHTLGKLTGKEYILSASLPAAASHLKDLEVDKITAVVDYINIMIWDLFGPWGKISNHNSPLYGPAEGDSTRCMDGAFCLYHEANKVPSSKINLGVAFYGHSYTRCTQIYGEHQGADTTVFKEEDGILYTQIAEKMHLFNRMWDPKAQTSFLVSPSLNMLISIDDAESVARKADYVIENNARGLLVWPLMGDYLSDGSTPLLDAIHNVISGN